MKSIFVSSTFKDMHEERDILHKRVIPELNEYAAQYGESVSLCDLRWGVNTEDLDSEEGSRKVLSVCLDEIDRCRPYMIVLLGERYGWIPEPETLREIEKARAGMNLEDLEKSVTALEIEYGSLGNKEQLEHTLFYFREFEGTVPEKYGREDALHERKLSELKERIRNLAGDRVYTYTVSWDAQKNTLKGLENFAKQMTVDLKALLEDEWKEYAILTPFERDQRLQWDFAQQKSDQFRAREKLIDQYISKLNQGQTLLAISGASGSGKSTLIGRLAVRLQEEGKEVLPIFCGSTMFCNDAMDVIRYIVRYIEDYFSLEHYEEKKQRNLEELAFEDETGYRENRTDIDRWTDRLSEMCVLYAEKSDREMIILIDALDQLFPDEIRDRLRFIPTNLSDKVKIVCSFLDNFDTGYHKKWEQVEQLLPLDETDKKTVIAGILHSHQERELPLLVIEKIMAKNGSDNPLYLSLGVQRLAMMDRDDYEKMTAAGDKMDSIIAYEMAVVDELPENLEELCMHLIHVVSEKLGNNMAELAVRYIAVSRYGLRETDLEGIFADQGIEWKSLDFTLFLRYMKSFFLLRDDGSLDFTHRSLRIGILKSVTKNEKKLHRQILKYLRKLDKRDEVRIREIIYHCWLADNQRYFVQYVTTYEDEKDIIRPAAKVSYEAAMVDNGKWLSKVIEKVSESKTNSIVFAISSSFLEFLNFEFNESFASSQKEQDIYQLIFNKVLGLAEKLAGAEGDIESRYALSVSYIHVGDICMRQGGQENLERARDMYEKSLQIREKLVEQVGEKISRSALSISYDRVGVICKRMGGQENLKKSRKMYEKSLEIREELAVIKKSSKNLRNLSISYIQVGDICMIQGGKENLKWASEMYERSMKIAKELMEIEGNSMSRRILSISYARVGDICMSQGEKENLRNALEMYEKSLEIREKLAVTEESCESWREVSASYDNVGDICMRQGGEENLKHARNMYEKSLKIREKLAEQDGESISRRALSISYERVGVICERLGGRENLKHARSVYERSLKIAEELAEIEENSESLRDLISSYIKIGDICVRQGGKENMGRACEMYERSLKMAKKLVETEESSANKRVLIVSYNKIGEFYERQGGEENIANAQEAYKRSLKIAVEQAETEETVDAYDDLAVGLYKVAMHPLTANCVRNLYIRRMKLIAELLYQKTANPRYLKLIEIAETILRY